MEDKTRDTIRAAAYETVRNDLRGSQVSKTTKKVTCTPPNKKCGGRCIPPSWSCRLKGEGTNSELKVHAQDISKGGKMVVSGTQDIIKGFATLNPQRFESGRSRVIRGAVKLAPGDNLEEKKQLRRKLEQNSNVIAGVTFGSLGIAGAYAAVRGKLPAKLREDIERPAKNAFNAVLDRAPWIGPSRARQRQAGEAAATTFGGMVTKGIKQNEAASAAAGNLGKIGPLAFRSTSADVVGSGLTQALDKVNRERKGAGFETWKQEATSTLFGAKTKAGHSVYSERAANEYLVSKFGLDSAGVERNRFVGRAVQEGATQAQRNTAVERGIASKLGQMGQDMDRDRKVRGIASVDTYKKEVALPAVERKLRAAGLSATQRKAGMAEASDMIDSAFGTNASRKASAKRIRQGTVDGYDTYFDRVATSFQRNADTPINGRAASTALGDGAASLARFEIGRKTGSSPQILSRSHADLLLREHYHTRVAKSGQYVVGENTARRVAQQITRTTSLPTTENAFQILNQNGFPNAVRGTAGSTKTGTSNVPASAPRTGVRAQTNLSALARSIQRRKGNEGMSYEAALRAARAEQKRKDSRADDEHTDPSITKRNPPNPLITNSPEERPMEEVLGEVIPKNEKEFVESLQNPAPTQSLAESPDPAEAEHPEVEEAKKEAATPIEIDFKLRIPASAIKRDAMPPRVAAYLEQWRQMNESD